jgi:hypothetical protein
MCVGLEAGVVEGLRRRERSKRQGRADRENGLKVARKEVIVCSGMVIVPESPCGVRSNRVNWRFAAREVSSERREVFGEADETDVRDLLITEWDASQVSFPRLIRSIGGVCWISGKNGDGCSQTPRLEDGALRSGNQLYSDWAVPDLPRKLPRSRRRRDMFVKDANTFRPQEHMTLRIVDTGGPPQSDK